MSTPDKASACRSSDYLDGLAFRFKFPKGANLALRSVQINDDIPELQFTAAKKVPTITEEDVATCVRLCLDNKRPEFFYMPFLPGHPFAGFGRHFKYYRPTYLRGTSVGELFAEVDWKMKCLHVGVKSDEEKKNFSSWPETSELDGLATHDDFSREPGSSQVLMACESVDVSESDKELMFVGEPKMKITDSGCSSYSEYITSKFDAVAYYDEPRFLKMKEIIKLVLAVEWMRDKGVKFSEEWVKEHTDKPRRELPKPVEVNLTDEEIDHHMGQLQDRINAALKDTFKIPAKYLTDSNHSEKQLEKNHFKTGYEIKLEKTFNDPFFKDTTDLKIPVTMTVVARVTMNDFDMLYQGITPNNPVILDPDSKSPVAPEVESFRQLFGETMPIPCKWDQDPKFPGTRTPVLTGGIKTSYIPVHSQKTAPPASVMTSVKANKSRKCQKASLPKRTAEPTHSKDARVPESRSENGRTVCGWIDNVSSSVASSDGKVCEQRLPLHTRLEITKSIGGKDVEYLDISTHNTLPPRQIMGRDANPELASGQPVNKGSPGDSAYSSVASTPSGNRPPLQFPGEQPSDSSSTLSASRNELDSLNGQQQQLIMDDNASVVSDSGVSNMSALSNSSTIADVDIDERNDDFD